ncbi:MAG: GntR family transcriptional regulator [Pseudonocardia sp.]
MTAELLGRAPVVVRRRGTPAHAQIEQWLVDQITCGKLATGDRLPGERELAAALRVSRMTLRQALDGLARRGVLVRLPGRAGGAFVAEPKIDCDLTGLAGFTEQMRRAHRRAGAQVVEARTVPAAEDVAAALGMAAGEDVHEVARVRSADGAALALERSWFPATLVVDLLDRPLTGSLYELLGRAYGLAPHTAVEYLEPVTARAAEAGALGVPLGTALMQVERTARTVAGVPVEFARDLYRADRVRLMLRTGVDGAPFTAAPSLHADIRP